VIGTLFKVDELRGSRVDSGSPLRCLVREVTVGDSVYRFFHSLSESLCFLTAIFERVEDRKGVENLRGEIEMGTRIYYVVSGAVR
jgi:hypothetical protein